MERLTNQKSNFEHYSRPSFATTKEGIPQRLISLFMYLRRERRAGAAGRGDDSRVQGVRAAGEGQRPRPRGVPAGEGVHAVLRRCLKEGLVRVIPAYGIARCQLMRQTKWEIEPEVCFAAVTPPEPASFSSPQGPRRYFFFFQAVLIYHEIRIYFEGCRLNIILIKTQAMLTKYFSPFLFQLILRAYECLINEGKKRL